MGAESKIYFTSPKNTMFNKHPVYKLDFSLISIIDGIPIMSSMFVIGIVTSL